MNQNVSKTIRTRRTLSHDHSASPKHEGKARIYCKMYVCAARRSSRVDTWYW